MTPPPAPAEPTVVLLLGLPFDLTTRAAAAAECLAAAADTAGPPRYAVTPNVDFVAQAEHDRHLREIVCSAWRSYCDGMPLVWLSRWFGSPLPERVAGSDLVHLLFAGAAREGLGIYFFGSDPKTLEAASAILRERHPGLRLCGHESPPMGPPESWDLAGMAARIRQARPHLLLVALGCPKQERFIYAHYRKLGVPLSLGIGASLDFVAGKQVRAPSWMQRTGLEWLWRLLDNPARLGGRYARDFRELAVLTVRQWRFQSAARRKARVLGPVSPPLPTARHPGAPPPEPPAALPGLEGLPHARVVWSGPIDAHVARALPRPPPDAPAVVVDCAGVTFMDSSGLGALIGVAREARARGAVLAVVRPSEPVTRLLQAVRLDSFLHLCADEAQAADYLRRRLGQTMLRTGQRPVLELPPRLGMEELQRLRRRMRDILAITSGKLGVVLGGSQVESWEPAAAGLLLTLRRDVREAGGELTLRAPSIALRQLLLIHGTEEVFPEEPDARA